MNLQKVENSTIFKLVRSWKKEINQKLREEETTLVVTHAEIYERNFRFWLDIIIVKTMTNIFSYKQSFKILALQKHNNDNTISYDKRIMV